jgi:hypothetical protein
MSRMLRSSSMSTPGSSVKFPPRRSFSSSERGGRKDQEIQDGRGDPSKSAQAADRLNLIYLFIMSYFYHFWMAPARKLFNSIRKAETLSALTNFIVVKK